jgi:hypothetical protein
MLVSCFTIKYNTELMEVFVQFENFELKCRCFGIWYLVALDQQNISYVSYSNLLPER